MNGTVLLVDDLEAIADLVIPELKKAGYKAHHVTSADAAFAYLKQETADLLLLDIGLPGISGLKFLEILKQDKKTANLPVILMTVEAKEAMKLQGFKTGADDYITKPFSTKELLARIEALLRRVRNAGEISNILKGGKIRMDLDRLQVTVGGKHVALTAGEFELLAFLMRRKGHVLTYNMIAEALSKGFKDMTSSNIYAHMKKLRAKLGTAGYRIETLYGTGYRFLED